MRRRAQRWRRCWTSRKTTDQVDGALKVVFEKFREYDVNFNQILTKHAVYDELVNRRGQPQGKGHSTGSTAWQETRMGLIHEKDIKMPLLTDRCENTETFRRWWKEVAEYCERSPRFP